MSQNTHIQKLLLMINRLTDRDLDRQMAVHIKYQELEDEGTARALPSAGLMGYLYHMVRNIKGKDGATNNNLVNKDRTYPRSTNRKKKKY